MNRKLFALSSLACLVWHGAGSAQVLEYIDCEVSDSASFMAASERFLDAMSGGERPTVSVDLNLWNGTDPSTHTVVVAYGGHQSLETFFDRIEQNQAAYMQLLSSLNEVSRCVNEGLAVELGGWGDMEAAWEFYAVYPVATTAAAQYAEAFEDFAGAVADDAPGPIYFYENRAGEEGVTHFVVFTSPSLASLNGFLDDLSASSDYASFVEAVADIRTLGTATQAQRIVTWAP